MAPRIPTTIGRFQVVRALGHGGMGSVYLARDPGIGRDVAVKVLRDGIDNPELNERFIREAQLAGKLRHINIVTIFEFGEYAGKPFIAMDYVQGHSLAELLQEQKLPLANKLQIMDGVCAGLDYAHRNEVVHRDISPANVVVGDDGVVKILDFGIARIGDSGLTQAGTVMGKFNYMAPEQMEGKAVDRRADIFAAGAVFYEVLSWRRAFTGDLREIQIKILVGSPEPLEELCPDLDPALIAIVNRCLEKQPDRRYPTMGAVRADLAAVRRRLARRDIAAGQLALEAGDDQQALSFFDNALTFDLENSEAIEGCEQARTAQNRRQINQAMLDARTQFENGAYGQAMVAVDRVLVLTPGLSAALDLRRAILEAVRDEEEARERTRAIDEVLARGRRCLANGSIPLALDAVRDLFALDPGNQQASALQSAIEAAVEQKRREDEQRAARQVKQAALQQFRAGNHEEGIRLLESFQPAVLVADDLAALRAQAAEMRRVLEEAERQRQEEEASRRAEIARKLGDATAALARQEFGVASMLIDTVLRRDPQSPEAAALRTNVEQAVRSRDALDALGDARDLLHNAQFDLALDACDRAAQIEPAVPGLLELRREIHERREIADGIVRAEARARSKKQQEAVVAIKQQAETAARLQEQARVAAPRKPDGDPAAAQAATVLVDWSAVAAKPDFGDIPRPTSDRTLAVPIPSPADPPAQLGAVPDTRWRTVTLSLAAVAALLLVIVLFAPSRQTPVAPPTTAVEPNPEKQVSPAVPVTTTVPSAPAPVVIDPPKAPAAPVGEARVTRPEVVAAREAALRLFRSGQTEPALVAALNGLALEPNDPPLTAVIDGLIRNASEAAFSAREEAIAAGALNLARDVFDRAEQLQRAADADRRNRKDLAIRGYWRAAETFRQATAQARTSGRTAGPKGPVPGPPGQVSGPVPVPSRGAKPEEPPPPQANPLTTSSVPLVETPATTTVPAPAPPSTAPPRPDPRPLIEQTLRAYAAGFSSNDINALQKAWEIPGAQVKTLQDAFRAAVYTVRINSIGTIAIDPNGRRATVTCEVRREVRPTGGGGSRSQTVETRTLFTLEERNGTWKIVDVQGR